MILVDNLIILVVAISVVVGLFRGFIPEVMSIIVWVAAAWLAWEYSDFVTLRIQDHVDSPVLATWLGRALTFAGVLIAGGVATALVSFVLQKTGLSGTDRILGMGFGFARGVLVVGLLVIFARALGFDEEPWWGESTLVPYGEQVADVIVTALPENLGESLPDVLKQAEGAAPGDDDARPPTPAPEQND